MLRKIALFLSIYFFLGQGIAYGEVDQKQIYEKRMTLYKETEKDTNIPWYYVAAIDQYERNIRSVRKDIPKKPDAIISIYFKPEVWAGPANSSTNDTLPHTISLFGGIGLDGDKDGLADANNDRDLLHTMATIIKKQGTSEDRMKIMLWEYYRRAKTVELITKYARIYKHYGRINLEGNAFPLPVNSDNSYRSTFGAGRSFGGRRIHEGTDIFAGYGVPVRSTCYGIIETKGWNRLGGWRIGIRDLYNNYHYYAHLGGFSKEIQLGQIVEPGKVIGFVGSTGYGPPGTAGKFPPHLHFGLYKDNGYTEWAFDPYMHLSLWERKERANLKNNRS
ncbi:M23 family peptidase [Bacillus cereus]|uniref:M23 family metallopeptidase n=1 Tax=unclassified Bacillus (in: firmicutes) TaxID=185979 RepID=UPI00047ED514|nr:MULTISPECIES: M23 family metallopeptidase [unclassified Bacillus (in: firmicutes)]PFE04788.1 M23 family peptidase [Bacillus sp. AFS023182]PGX96043.1 M23 family peptidase [Bacillus cereus]SDZ31373.1 Murein DD-endopeptidase MepM and murein hydrolase activator NlpD, contain LysM domain [Bacillus sp. 166amftsu]